MDGSKQTPPGSVVQNQQDVIPDTDMNSDIAKGGENNSSSLCDKQNLPRYAEGNRIEMKLESNETDLISIPPDDEMKKTAASTSNNLKEGTMSMNLYDRSEIKLESEESDILPSTTDQGYAADTDSTVESGQSQRKIHSSSLGKISVSHGIHLEPGDDVSVENHTNKWTKIRLEMDTNIKDAKLSCSGNVMEITLLHSVEGSSVTISPSFHGNTDKLNNRATVSKTRTTSKRNSVVGETSANAADKPFICFSCGMACRCQSALNRHMLTHSDVRAHKCSTCRKSFKRKEDLLEHNKTHKKVKKKESHIFEISHTKLRNARVEHFVSESCSDDDVEFNDFTDKLLGEKKAKDSTSGCGVTDKCFKCSVCSMEFSFQSTLRNHMVRHSKERPYVCPMCHKSFKRKYELIKHKETHGLKHEDAKSERKKKGGGVLKLSFMDSEGSKVRKKVVKEKQSNGSLSISDAGDRPFKCHECDMAFQLKTHLARHVLVHSEKRPYVCSVCNKQYKRKDDLVKHEKIHIQTKDMNIDKAVKSDCEQVESTSTQIAQACSSVNGKQLVNSSDCISHLTKKSDEMEINDDSHKSDVEDETYKCPHCPATFPSMSSLSSHMTLHSEQRHVCYVCRKGFKTWVSLAKHIKIHFTDRKSRLPQEYHQDDGESSRLIGAERMAGDGDNLGSLHGQPGNEAIAERIQKMIVEGLAMDTGDWMGQEVKMDNPIMASGDLEIGNTQTERVAEILETNNHKQTSGNLDIGRREIINEVMEMNHEKGCASAAMHEPQNADSCSKYVSNEGEEITYPCQICKQPFNTIEDLRNHFVIHDENLLSEYSGYNKVISQNEKEQSDLNVSTDSPSKLHVCFMCGKSYIRLSDLKTHQKRMHENETHPELNEAVQQDKTSHNEHENSLTCSVCKTVCSDISEFVAHMKGHTVVSRHVCSWCGKGFTSSNNLKQHVRRHKGEKPFKCSDCNSSFASKGELMRHTTVHTGKKMYMCDICGTEFTLISSLRTHSRLHTGIKPYKCSLCPKTFNQGHQLKTHLRSHSGEKPHKCMVCGKAFSDRRTLRNHMLRHTEEQTSTANFISM